MANDDDLKHKAAEEWSVLYKRDFKKEDMICNGCKSEVVFTLCALCDIRICNENHAIGNCIDCGVFPCERINRFFAYHKTRDTGAIFE